MPLLFFFVSMFWSTNDKPVMMLGDDASLYHDIKVTEKSKGKAECSLFSGNSSMPVCKPSQERSVVCLRIDGNLPGLSDLS